MRNLTETFTTYRVEDHVAVLTLNRPQALNALSREVLSEIGAHLAMLDLKDVRVLVIRGEGRVFCAGADIGQMQHMSAVEAESMARLGQRVFQAIEQLPIPVIALIHGGAFGGGLELALACDFRIAAAGAVVGLPEVTLGVNPSFGGTYRLPRAIGFARALSMMLLGERIPVEKALEYGLVNEVVAPDELEARGMDLARKLASQSSAAMAAIKRSAHHGFGQDPARAQAYEAAQFGLCFASGDAHEGMAAFKEKRQARFHED
ncbi:enoyl-CoA hydratase/isomerase family protein [Alicyclobacillus acidocaldarius]|uniref:enoyl-CoA hydratase/isomerase family protein n=1 Tax=Alicyclobacillus acidocaldarius TaxID=405212 RepID=UPI00023AB34E|nr:enoyl-CoA hydratase-related protein [Alicyclobacillus acidocaldarius]